MGEDDTLDLPLSGGWDASTLPAPEGREHEPDPGHSDEQLRELLFASYDESVMWRRVYPARHRAQSSSFFGGVPLLGDHMPWPRSHDGRSSLMFVGQIDLTHVPDFSLRALLPDAGALFFFFGITENEDPFGRVVFDPSNSASHPPRQPPSDRMPFYKDSPPEGCRWVDRTRLADFKYHAEFPRYDVEPVLCRLFADHHPTHHWGETGGRYQRMWKRAQSQEILRQFGKPYARWWPSLSETSRKPDGSLREQQDGGALGRQERPNLFGIAQRVYGEPWLPDDHWPYNWLFVEIAMAPLLEGVARATNEFQYETERRPERRDFYAGHLARYARTAAAVKDWLDRARRAGSYDPLPATEREDFRHWVSQIGEKELILDPDRDAKKKAFEQAMAAWRLRGADLSKVPRSEEEGPHDAFFVGKVMECLSTSLMRGVELSLVESPEAAALIPKGVVEFFRWRHEPLHDNGRRFIRHQLLGPPRTLQYESMELAKTHLLLMQFDTDDPMHWIWGDMGVLQYWITRESLKARRFDDVIVTMEGG